MINRILYTSADTRIQELQKSLIDVNEDATHCVQLHPLYTNTGMSVDQLYAELVVREDLASIQRMFVTKPDDRYRIVKSSSDLFTKDGKPVRNVFMLGQPGHGKTTLCLYLLKCWCTAKSIIMEESNLSVWQLGMLDFDFVFFISLRHVDRCRSSVMDMICEDVFERDDGNKDVIRHVLSSPDYRCLIIVDGLDEWKYSQDVQEKLRQKGLPNTGELSTKCTVLYASRHWKVDLIQPKYSKSDIVVEILGLNDKGANTIIQNILVNFFKLEIDSPEYEAKFDALKKQLQNTIFKSAINIPLLLSTFVFLGFDGTYEQRLVIGLALDQLELLIRRGARHIGKEVIKGLNKSFSNKEIPRILQKNNYLSQFISVLYKLGKIAFNDLVSKQSHLVFDLESLQETVGVCELELALKVGIVGQMQAPGRFHIPKVSIEFFHKSIQEALAALYVVCDKSIALTSLCEYCYTIEQVMEISNVLQYIAGICPIISSHLSKHIVHVANNDKLVKDERVEINLILGERARMLYNMQCLCHKEMTHILSSAIDFEPSTKYHVSDVVLHYYDDNDKVKITCDMMHGCPDSVVSFAMSSWHDTSWSAGPVLQILPHCCHLTTLQIAYEDKEPDPELVCVIPTLSHLERVEYYHWRPSDADRGDVDSRVVRAVVKLPQLRHVKLGRLELDGSTLVLTAHLTEIQKVELNRVRISTEGWTRFVTSLFTVGHAVDIAMEYCNIDDVARGMIHNKEHFTVSESDRYTIKFVAKTTHI